MLFLARSPERDCYCKQKKQTGCLLTVSTQLICITSSTEMVPYCNWEAVDRCVANFTDPYTFFFHKNIVYKNIHLIFKIIIRILLSLSSRISVSFFRDCLFCDVDSR